jgi:transposase
VTDLSGNILALVVHAANPHDTTQGGEVFQKALSKYPNLLGVCADAGYRKTFENSVKSLGLKVEIAEQLKYEFETLPKPWRGERTFSWLNNYRRLANDYEITTTSEESYIEISSISLLLSRLFKA